MPLAPSARGTVSNPKILLLTRKEDRQSLTAKTSRINILDSLKAGSTMRAMCHPYSCLALLPSELSQCIRGDPGSQIELTRGGGDSTLAGCVRPKDAFWR
jgi:hypothetical protein